MDGDGYGRRSSGGAGQWQLWTAQQRRKMAWRRCRTTQQRQGGEVAAARRGGARGREMVVDRVGATRTAQRRKVGEAAWKVEDCNTPCL
jgi:hypothetical protein